MLFHAIKTQRKPRNDTLFLWQKRCHQQLNLPPHLIFSDWNIFWSGVPDSALSQQICTKCPPAGRQRLTCSTWKLKQFPGIKTLGLRGEREGERRIIRAVMFNYLNQVGQFNCQHRHVSSDQTWALCSLSSQLCRLPHWSGDQGWQSSLRKQ